LSHTHTQDVVIVVFVEHAFVNCNEERQALSVPLAAIASIQLNTQNRTQQNRTYADAKGISTFWFDAVCTMCFKHVASDYLCCVLVRSAKSAYA